MFEYIGNPWYIALIIMITQYVFLYLRTLNVIYVAEKKITLALLTGVSISVCWLIAITFSINAISNLQWQPIIGYLVGGLLGSWQALVFNKKQK